MPEVPGDGGVGYSWFAIELTSDHVPDGPVQPRPPGTYSSQPRSKKNRFEDSFDVKYKVVETVVEEFRVGYSIVEPERFEVSYAVVESNTVSFDAIYSGSTDRADDEEVLLLMLMDES